MRILPGSTITTFQRAIREQALARYRHRQDALARHLRGVSQAGLDILAR